MSLRRHPLANTQVDVTLGQLPAEAVGLEIVKKVASKGFCVIAPGFEDGTLEKALEEISEFDALQRWYKVNPIVQDGLLGAEGSSSIAELEPPDLDEEVRGDGEILTKLDYTITQLGFRMEPHLNRLGCDMSHRSVAVLHQAGEPDEEPVPLTEKQVAKWLAQFLRHKVMVTVFLGPTPGTLELKPYETDDTDILEIRTVPGTIVVLRPDLLSHKHFSPGRAIVMSSFFLSGQAPKRSAAGGTSMIPPARELDDWTMGRLRELKMQMQEDSPWDPQIPRDWQSAMNHLYHKGQMIAVRGTACKVPLFEDPDTFFQVATGAPDLVVEVPLLRWDHSEVYDPDPDSWRRFKSYCKHASFMDGIELFDCKMFSMSPNEAKSMDPHQRLILEVGYSALYHMGKRKNTLVNSTCGVYVGCGNLEWSVMPREADFGAFGATGGALSISSGRFSFTLGLKGPSMTLDTEASSGSSSIYLSAESVQRKGRSTPNDFAVAIGAHLVLAALWWPTHCASGWLSAEGRCLTFNASAAGYVRGDGVAAVAVKCLTELVDGSYVTNDQDPLIGSIAGAMMNNNGKGASLAAPHGPAEQEAIAEAIRNASVSPFDVDAVETSGTGAFLADAIEVGSLLRAHRSEDHKEPLVLMAAKSSIGNQIETSGILSFLKSIYSSQWGMVAPNLHLRQANPHMDAFDQPCGFATDCLEYRMQSSFVGIMSRGFGGSNVYLLTWGQVNVDKVPPPAPPSLKDSILYWPGGGGELEGDMRPSKTYTIVGSWSLWGVTEPMDVEGDGMYSFTVTLGENRWEQFQIWLDGDSARALHPAQAKASKDSPVSGPSAEAAGLNWQIDGRGEIVGVPAEQGGARLDYHSIANADSGQPGDQYRIHLCVAGRWRTVTWEKLQAGAPKEEAPVSMSGRYFVTGTWNDWSLQDMESDPATGGFFADALLLRNGGEFQIVRNKDWSQVFYPNKPKATSQDSSEVLGPDDLGHGLNWFLDGKAGDTFRIQFQRSVATGQDAKAVSWTRTEREKLSTE